MSDTASILLWHVKDSEHAHRYCKLRDSRSPGADVPDNPNYLWVPKSIVEGRTKIPAQDEERAIHFVKLPDWFIERENL